MQDGSDNNRDEKKIIITRRKDILHSPVDSILEATLTVSPKRQYLGIFFPTTPVSINL